LSLPLLPLSLPTLFFSTLTKALSNSTAALADTNLASLPVGSIIQFERKGFYILDRAHNPSSPSEPAVLIFIPDGKASSIALKYVAPAKEGGKDAKKAGEKKTSAKDKVAAVAQKKAAATPAAASSSDVLRRIPELAPKEAVNIVLKSDGTKGFEIPVTVRLVLPSFSFLSLFGLFLLPLRKVRLTLASLAVQTKMYYSPPINGGHDYPVPVKTEMFEVPPVHYQS
jgi:hypothetical protein